MAVRIRPPFSGAPIKATLIDRFTGALSGPWISFFTALSDEVGRVIYASEDGINPPPIAGNSFLQVTFQMPDAEVGDFAEASIAPANPDVLVHAHVTATRTVRVTFQNITATPIDLPEVVLHVKLEKRNARRR